MRLNTLRHTKTTLTPKLNGTTIWESLLPWDNLGVPAPWDNLGVPAPLGQFGSPCPPGTIWESLLPWDNLGVPAPLGQFGSPCTPGTIWESLHPWDNLGVPAPLGQFGSPCSPGTIWESLLPRGAGLAQCLPPMCPGFDSWTRRHMWVEFVVGSLLYSTRFFSRYSRFPLSSKTNIFKFPIRSWNALAFLNDFFELLGALWVNKLHIYKLHIYI